MNNTTKILVNEHKDILKVAEKLILKADEAENEKIDEKFFIRAIDFIRNYADKFHHAKEEDILFKELCRDTVHLHCNPVEQMLTEHDLGRNFVKGIEQGTKEKNPEKIAENARNYASLIQEHIYKEDNILYPMADETLSKDAQISMFKKFQEVEKKSNVKKYKDFVKGLK